MGAKHSSTARHGARGYPLQAQNGIAHQQLSVSVGNLTAMRQEDSTNAPSLEANYGHGINAVGGSPVVLSHRLPRATCSRTAAAARARRQRRIRTERDSDSSSEEDVNRHNLRRLYARSLPAWSMLHAKDFKCPVCSKTVPSDDVEVHIVMCLTRPKITYNEDVLTETLDECAICLDDLVVGNNIARLPCLCVYHKRCIDLWFKKNRSCPEHPLD